MEEIEDVIEDVTSDIIRTRPQQDTVPLPRASAPRHSLE